MTRDEKSLTIEKFTESLREAKTLYLTDIAGLNAVQTTNLRRTCFKADVQLVMVKNKLLAKAMEASDKDFGGLTDVLKGNTSLMFSDTGNIPANIIKEFRKKSDKLILKGAFIEEAIYIGDEQLDLLVSLKSREELIGEIITILQSPVKNVVSALQSGGGKLSGILKTLSKQSV